ncbi:hypothetical protein [Caldifermentibacillus hisashii]|uniref:hypothetical protein n=1 Tax=Caldifermentibacillus hisashii TaxID=996558 RepID=UPI0034D5EDEF
MATSPVLVVVLSRRTQFFGDEPCFRHYFGQKILFYIDETSPAVFNMQISNKNENNGVQAFAKQFERRIQSGPVS